MLDKMFAEYKMSYRQKMQEAKRNEETGENEEHYSQRYGGVRRMMKIAIDSMGEETRVLWKNKMIEARAEIKNDVFGNE